MKKILLFLCMCLLVALTLYACKKDYPQDIPDWLKDKIESLEKQAKKEKKDGSGPEERRWIHEYSNDTINIYRYYTGYIQNGVGACYEIFDVNGNEMCSYCNISSQCTDNISASDLDNKFYLFRKIWTQKK